MQEAIRQARKSLSEGGIPIGSALTKNGELVASGHNKRVQENNPILHGEMDCLNNAGRVRPAPTASPAPVAPAGLLRPAIPLIPAPQYTVFEQLAVV